MADRFSEHDRYVNEDFSRDRGIPAFAVVIFLVAFALLGLFWFFAASESTTVEGPAVTTTITPDTPPTLAPGAAPATPAPADPSIEPAQ